MDWQLEIAYGRDRSKESAMTSSPQKAENPPQVQSDPARAPPISTLPHQESEKQQQRQARQQEVVAATEIQKKSLKDIKQAQSAKLDQEYWTRERSAIDAYNAVIMNVNRKRPEAFVNVATLFEAEVNAASRALHEQRSIVHTVIGQHRLVLDQQVQNFESKIEANLQAKLAGLKTIFEEEDIGVEEGRSQNLQENNDPTNLASLRPDPGRLENPLHARTMNSQKSSLIPSKADPLRGVLTGRIDKGATGGSMLGTGGLSMADKAIIPARGAANESLSGLSRSALSELKMRDRQLGAESPSTVFQGDAYYGSLSPPPLPPPAVWYRDPKNQPEGNNINDIVCQGLAISGAAFSVFRQRLIGSSKAFGIWSTLSADAEACLRETWVSQQVSQIKEKGFAFVKLEWLSAALNTLLLQAREQTNYLYPRYPILQVQYQELDGSLFIWHSDDNEVKLHLRLRGCFRLFMENGEVAEQFEYCTISPATVDEFIYNPAKALVYLTRPTAGEKGNNGLWLQFNTPETLEAFVEAYVKGWPKKLAIQNHSLDFLVEGQHPLKSFS